MNINFDKNLNEIINAASDMAKETGKTQKVYVHLDGWFDYGEEMPLGTQLIGEINLAEVAQVQARQPDSRLIQIDEKSWIDSSKFWSFEIKKHLLFARNEEGVSEFRCDPEMAEREIKRIYASGNADTICINIDEMKVDAEGLVVEGLKSSNGQKVIVKTVKQMEKASRKSQGYF